MSEKNITIRLENKDDYRAVENLTRESFWNVYRPGCMEHYVLHCYRDDPAFVPELDFVMELDGELIGQVIYVRSEIDCDDGRKVPIMTFGPSMAQDFINVELVRQSNLQGRSSELYNQFISQVNNFCRTYSDVHFYADQLNVSGRYLAQVTRRISGKTPKAIIDEYIVKEIERELSTTTHTVQEIANTFGFSSQAHLTKFFKKMRGVTPSAFRQKG